MARTKVRGITPANIGTTKARRAPDPVIIPIPYSGNVENPYFVNVTRAMDESSARSTTIDRASAMYDRHHRGYYLVTTNYPWSVVLPKSGGGNRSDGNSSGHKCDSECHSNSSNTRLSSSPLLQRTSQQAANRFCNVVATNGGPFDAGGTWNSGPTVSNGRLIRTKANPEESHFIGFGIGTVPHSDDNRSSTSSKQSMTRRYWVMGRYGQLVNVSSTFTIWDFVTGFDWLVYNGEPRVIRSQNSSINSNSHLNNKYRRKNLHRNPTGAVRAPRTAVGLDKSSNLMLLVVDGCQHCLFKKGLTLEELAGLLVHLGAVYAINMDGGGSSTMVMPSDFVVTSATRRDSSTNTSIVRANDDRTYTVINHPTCLDLPFPYCERAVSTVHCVSTNGAKS